MAFGDFVSSIFQSTSSDLGSIANTAGNIFGQYKDIKGQVDDLKDLFSTGEVYRPETAKDRADRKTYEIDSAMGQALASANQVSSNAQQFAAQDAALRERILQQTGDLGDRMRSAYASFGDQPVVDASSVQRDYHALKAIGQSDLDRLVQSTGDATGALTTERLGGAGGQTSRDFAAQELVRRFAPEQAKVDSNAYSQAIARARGESDLYTSNRRGIIDVINAALGAQPQAESAILANSPASSLAGTSASQYSQLIKALSQQQSNAAAVEYDAAGNPKQPTTQQGKIIWDPVPPKRTFGDVLAENAGPPQATNSAASAGAPIPAFQNTPSAPPTYEGQQLPPNQSNLGLQLPADTNAVQYTQQELDDLFGRQG